MRVDRLRTGVLSRFSILSAVALVAVGVALSWILGGQIRAGALDQATRSAEVVARTSIAGALEGDDPADGLSASAVARLDRLTASAANEGALDELTVWSRGAVAVYASEDDTARRGVAASAAVEAALRGEPTIRVAGGEVMEVAVPLGLTGQPPVGAAEMRLPFAPVRSAIARQRLRSTLALAAGLGLLFALLLVIVATVSRRLRRQAEEHEFLALHDPLTDLPNRILFHDRVAQCAKERLRGGQEAAVMLLDLDRFKDVNDTLGHRSGDLVLAEVARRLSGRLRRSDTLARLGGDEFGVLLPTVTGVAGATKVANGLRSALAAPFLIDGVTLSVGASIGVALLPEHGSDPDTLLQRADRAMYVAKGARNGHAIYDPLADGNAREQLELTDSLRRAIAHGELRLEYQPKAELATRRIRSVEALVRWQHPERGLLPPNAFIPLAESTGLIRQLTYWVLDEAVRQCRAWADQGHRLKVAVNLSQKSLLDDSIPTTIAMTLERHRLPPKALEIEITESALVSDLEAANDALTTLHRMGVSLSIDDYGTGYSTLAHLRGLPVSCIKIDRSFVSGMLVDPKSATIVRSTIALARDLGIGVVAEGVETSEEWQALDKLGCWMAQGYLVSRPKSGPELMAWIERTGGAHRMDAMAEALVPLPDF